MARIAGLLLVLGCLPWTAAAGEGGLLQATERLHWYRGNTHAHTLWSDGDAPPEIVVAWYRDRGYHFLCLSEHNVIAQGTAKWHPIEPAGSLTAERVAALRDRFGSNWVREHATEGRRYLKLKTLPQLRQRFEDGRFVLIAGEEITSWSPHVHVNGINLQEPIVPVNEASVSATIVATLDAIDEQSQRLGRPMLGHVNHPNWGSGVTAEQIAAATGERFFEVYNGHPDVRNAGSTKQGMPSTERLWDIVLALRLSRGEPPLFGLATDDAHAYYEQRQGLANSGRGWIVVLAETLDADTIVRAMQAGRFYASTGVALDEVRWDRNGMTVAIRPEPGVDYRVEFIGTRIDFDPASNEVLDPKGRRIRSASRRYSDTIGTVLHATDQNPARFRFSGHELYVRTRVVSSKLQENPSSAGDREMAWTQPVTVRGGAERGANQGAEGND